MSFSNLWGSFSLAPRRPDLGTRGTSFFLLRYLVCSFSTPVGGVFPWESENENSKLKLGIKAVPVFPELLRLQWRKNGWWFEASLHSSWWLPDHSGSLGYSARLYLEKPLQKIRQNKLTELNWRWAPLLNPVLGRMRWESSIVESSLGSTGRPCPKVGGRGGRIERNKKQASLLPYPEWMRFIDQLRAPATPGIKVQKR